MTLFAGIAGPNVWITRMRGDIAHAAMSADLVLDATPDQSELSNIRTATRSVNEVCPCGSLNKGCAAAPAPSTGAARGLGGLAVLFGLAVARGISLASFLS